MQSEDFDDKVRNAADHHHPSYDEKAWDKMVLLLNKHLPQEKDNRRRFIFFLLLLLLLGGGTWFIASKPGINNKSTVQLNPADSKKQDKLESGIKMNSADEKTNITTPSSKGDKIKAFEAPVTTDDNQPVNLPSLAAEADKKTPFLNNVKEKKENLFFNLTDKSGKSQGKKTLKQTNNIIRQKDNIMPELQSPKPFGDIEKKDAGSNVATITSGNITNNNVAGENVVGQDVVTNSKPVSTPGKIAEDKQISKTKTAEPLIEKPVVNKSKKKTTNSFFFTLSAGADVSFVGSDKLGTAKLLTGAGLGYNFNNRFTIRAGVYSGRKIYSASGENYHPPADFYMHYRYLQNVDADCKVIEIPVSFSYNFNNAKKQTWFVSGGLSSFLMKKESYNYFYKYTATGPTINKKSVINNENKHYFSVLTVSGGYQRNLNKNVSIMVEPYIKMPLSGVGYGKVKLNSTGLLFSVGIKPFNNSKKKP
jgi:hypothetical protein